MVVGSVIVTACLIVMGWTKEIVHSFMEEGESARKVTILIAVLSIYAVDFAINAGKGPAPYLYHKVGRGSC